MYSVVESRNLKARVNAWSMVESWFPSVLEWMVHV